MIIMATANIVGYWYLPGRHTLAHPALREG